jgi:hypothetical protein
MSRNIIDTLGHFDPSKEGEIMIRVLTAALLLATLTSGCAMSANAPVTGSIYQGAKGATTATGNALTEKVGKSCASSILGAIGLGDASIASAAKAGGITKVSSVDSENFGVLGIYATNCTVVTGE